MLTFCQASTLVHLLAKSSHIPGDICEFGVNAGRTSCLMAACSSKKLWMYDSCDGLPAPEGIDGIAVFRGGLAAPASAIENTFNENAVPMATLIPAWFCDLKPDQLPDKIAFAHIDADLYRSTLDALNLVYPRVSSDGIVLFHDWDTGHIPAVEKAIREFMTGKPEQIVVPRRLDGLTGQQAYFVKI
jgi:O-methyltransferase